MSRKKSRFIKPSPAPLPSQLAVDATIVSADSTTISVVDKEALKEERKEYLELRKSYVDKQYLAYEILDRTILTITSAAFTVSIAIVQFIGRRDSLYILGISWLLLALALLSSLISLVLAPDAIRRQVELLDADFQGSTHQSNNSNWFDSGVKWLNYTMVACCVVGIAAFAIFVYLNL